MIDFIYFMKILILIGPFASLSSESYGGVEKFWLTMGKKFNELGHKITFISKKINGDSKDKIIDKILFKRINGFLSTESKFSRFVLDFLYTIKAALVLPNEIDIIVTNTFWSPIILPFIVNKKTKIYVDVARMPKGQIFLYKYVARLRVNTNIVKKNIIKEVSSKLAKKIKVIPPSLPFISPRNINLKNKKPLIVYLGRIHEEKGIELFINSLKKINLKRWKVKIIGPWKINDGGSGLSYLNYLTNQITNKSITIENPISVKKIFKLYKQTAIFVYPSLAKNETFGLSVAEFMSYGAVPIVSNLDCFKDYITHNYNGMIFNHEKHNSNLLLSNYLEKLIKNNKFRLKLSKKAFNINKTHSVNKIAQTLLSDFKNLIK